MNPFKPGWQTTEFWQALFANLLTLLVLSGTIAVGDRDTLSGALTNAVTAIGALWASASVVVNYIRARTTVKTASSLTAANAVR